MDGVDDENLILISNCPEGVSRNECNDDRVGDARRQ